MEMPSELTRIFNPLSVEERLKTLYHYFDEEEILITSSFGTNAVLLLHLISRIRPQQKIYFIDTTYHFPETLAYKAKLIEEFGLNVISVSAYQEGNNFTTKNQTWKDNPDLCCQINKVSPLEVVKSKHKLWISGVIGYQTPFRQHLQVFEKQDRMIKFHPLIDWTQEEVEAYFQLYQLPEHPLQHQGYGSVGCSHCTAKGAGREGRWKGKGKIECGLHLEKEFAKAS